jgi:hypothetical protein
MADNTFTKGYADSTALTETQLDTAYKSLKLDISNTTSLTSGSTAGQFLKSNGSAVAASFASVPDPLGPFALRNYGLSTSVSAGALTVALKTKALSDASASDAIDFTYSSNGTTSATYNAVQVTGALSFTITASATLGFTTTSTNRVFVYGYYNTATSGVKLAVSARADLDLNSPITMTVMSAAADSLTILYATAALSVAPRLLGYFEAALNTAKQWQSATKVNVGQTSQAIYNRVVVSDSCSTFNTTSTAFVDVTNLSVTLNTTGKRPVCIKTISDVAGADSFFRVAGPNSGSAGNYSMQVKILRGTSAIAVYKLGVPMASQANPLHYANGCLEHFDFPSTAGSYTYKVQICSNNATNISVGAVYLKLMAYEI